MQWLKDAGVSVVAIEFIGWSSNINTPGRLLDAQHASLAHVIPAVKAAGLKFVLLYDFDIRFEKQFDLNDDVRRSDFVNDFSTLLNNDIFADEAYLKFEAPGGGERPVVYF